MRRWAEEAPAQAVTRRIGFQNDPVALGDEKWTLLPFCRVYLYVYNISDGMYVFSSQAVGLEY
jgi:hypothetical protein